MTESHIVKQCFIFELTNHMEEHTEVFAALLTVYNSSKMKIGGQIGSGCFSDGSTSAVLGSLEVFWSRT